MWNTSVSDNGSYPNFCKLAASDDYVFSSFKRNEIYNRILEHTHPQYGVVYAQIVYNQLGSIEKFKDIISRASANDQIGGASPLTFVAEGQNITISPSTMRYIKVAFDVANILGSDFKNKTVCEIGGGYGGQCLVFSAIFGFKQWDILDLKEANMLQRKYLDIAGVKNASAQCLDDETLTLLDHYDIVISNYALSECKRSIQDAYISKVLMKSSHGYLTMNYCWNNQEQGENWCENNGFSDMVSIAELKSIIPSLMVSEEFPNTHPSNRVLIW